MATVIDNAPAIATPKRLNLFERYVFTVCNSAREACPIFPGGGKRLHEDFEDPAAAPPAEQLAVFRKVRDQLRRRVEKLVADESSEQGPK